MSISLLRAIRAVAWATVAALAGAVAWIVVLHPDDAGRPGVMATAIGGPFTLSDQHGATVTEAALQGHPSALFFGYTFCPDVCPTTLADITAWLHDLGADADRLRVYFITVDPERDTQAAIASYLQAFDPRIVGLTGPQAAIDTTIKAFRVFAQKVPGKDGAPYTMNHSASVYLLDSQGRFVGTVDYQENRETALAKLRRLIARS